MFYRVQHAMTALSLVDQNTLLPTFLMATVLNSMRQFEYSDFSEFYALMKPIAASVISTLSRALPEPLLDVLRERTFAAAIEAGDVDTVTFMLVRLNADPLEATNISGSIDSPIDYSLQCGIYEVTKVLVTHVCQRGNVEHMAAALDIVCRSYPANIHGRKLSRDKLELACIVLSAGAFPRKGCVNLSRTDFYTLKRLVKTSKNDIRPWLRIGLLTPEIRRGTSIDLELCNEDTLSYVLREFRHQLSISDPDTITALLEALHCSTKEKKSWATETILCTLDDLGFHFSLNSNNEENIRTLFEEAYLGDSWNVAASLITTEISTVGGDGPATDGSASPREPFEEIKAKLISAINQDDITGLTHLCFSSATRLDYFEEFDLFKLVIKFASDGMVLAFIRHATAKRRFFNRNLSEVLAQGRVKVISDLLSAMPKFRIALAVARERKDFGPLDDLLHTNLLNLSVTFRDDRFMSENYQLNLRSLVYHAIETKKKALMMWLLACGLDFEELILITNRNRNELSHMKRSITRYDLDRTIQGVIPSLLGVVAARNEILWMELLFEHGAGGRDSMALLNAVVHKANDVTIRMLLEVARSQPRCGRSIYGSAALQIAVRRRDGHMINLLWDTVDVDGIESPTLDFDDEGRCVSPLGEAILMADLNIVSILLRKGANPNALVAYEFLEGPRGVDPTKRVTPLLAAIYVGSLPIVKTLIEAGALIDYKQRLGLLRTPLQKAAERGHFDIVQYLIEKGAKIDTVPAPYGGTAMQLAAVNGYVGIATLLLEHGANPNYPPPPGYGRTAFELAAEWSRVDMMLLLMRWGVQLDLKFGDPPETQYDRARRLAEANGYHASKRFVHYLYGIASRNGRAQDRDTSSSPLQGMSPSTPTASPGPFSAEDARTLGLSYSPMHEMFPSSLMDFAQETWADSV
jgi:hypothetical protein